MADEDELVLSGTLIEGLDVEHVELDGLRFIDEQNDLVCGEISTRRLLIEVLDCEQVEIEESDAGAGMSDSTYEYYCGPKADFIARLRAELCRRADSPRQDS